jgi:hypothetical protein
MKIKRSTLESVSMFMLVFAVLLLAFNTYNINKLTQGNIATAAGVTQPASSASLSNVIPTGVPEVYGSELQISYDDVSANTPQKADQTIAVMADIDREITLEGDDLDRYITIVSEISCEYCCGVKSIIFPDGKPACGCAHSYAMRGLAKHLIVNHPDEFTDDQILEELGKWKVLFFPTQMTQKAGVLADNGIEMNYVNLASNAYRGIEKGVSGGMVGGC